MQIKRKQRKNRGEREGERDVAAHPSAASCADVYAMRFFSYSFLHLQTPMKEDLDYRSRPFLLEKSCVVHTLQPPINFSSPRPSSAAYQRSFRRDSSLHPKAQTPPSQVTFFMALKL